MTAIIILVVGLLKLSLTYRCGGKCRTAYCACGRGVLIYATTEIGWREPIISSPSSSASAQRHVGALQGTAATAALLDSTKPLFDCVDGGLLGWIGIPALWTVTHD